MILISAPVCSICKDAFKAEFEFQTICGDCIENPPKYHDHPCITCGSVIPCPEFKMDARDCDRYQPELQTFCSAICEKEQPLDGCSYCGGSHGGICPIDEAGY